MPGATAVRDRVYGSPSASPYEAGSLRPVVYLPTWARWDVMKQRPQYLLQALADAGHDVYFVDPRHGGPDQVTGRVTITSGLTSVPSRDVIVYTHFAPTRTMLDQFEGAAVIYDILDDLTIYDPDEVGLPPERKVRFHHEPLMQEASIVITSNAVLAGRHRSEREDLILIENGVDAELFTPELPGVDLGDGPIVGYHGAIRSWIDFDLLHAVAESRPQYRFVLVGPVLRGVEEPTARLEELPNVRRLPEQDAAGVARHVRSFTVGIIPFVVNVTTQGVNPMKLNEYLASGVPVVATPLPSCVAHPEVLVGADARTWGSLLDQAVGMTAEDRLRMREAGLEASWDRLIRPLLQRLESLGLRHVPSADS